MVGLTRRVRSESLTFRATPRRGTKLPILALSSNGWCRTHFSPYLMPNLLKYMERHLCSSGAAWGTDSAIASSVLSRQFPEAGTPPSTGRGLVRIPSRGSWRRRWTLFRFIRYLRQYDCSWWVQVCRTPYVHGRRGRGLHDSHRYPSLSRACLLPPLRGSSSTWAKRGMLNLLSCSTDSIGDHGVLYSL